MVGPRQHPDVTKAIQRVQAGLTVKEAASIYKVHPTTIWKAIRKLKAVGQTPTSEVEKDLQDIA